MKFAANPNAPDKDTFMALVDRIDSMELTRAQAAALAGVTVSAFNNRLARYGVLERLKHTRRSAGELAPNAEKDPDKVAAYKAAIDHALACGNVREAHRRHPLTDLQVLGRKVRKVRAERGLPQQRAGRKPRAEEASPPA